ncbi:hypothetical protein K432DRAFT_385524 [Lepidopterella palustris CBS 459.81]|uniref:Uncharacterized protein n=1 Tax=Lepidopterella palustris CBS 459.81 TaxID=1314670 RepID=A0A8E2E2U1_9PEZI|nr:hypothetical protein K432DRAFT_385524 [Lepidopterella palustris CBS 459.81]
MSMQATLAPLIARIPISIVAVPTIFQIGAGRTRSPWRRWMPLEYPRQPKNARLHLAEAFKSNRFPHRGLIFAHASDDAIPKTEW